MHTARLKILILEDNDADAEMIQRLLEKTDLNYHCKVMMTKDAYIKALNEFEPDIILSDNTMPQFNASEALEILKHYALHIPFILVTGTVSEEFAAGIIKAGADDYLLKDRLTRLPAAIETALKQKQTEREKLEATEKLIRSEKRFRALVENNDGIIALVDKDLNSLFRSSSAAKITGWTNAEFEKVDTRQYIHPGDLVHAQEVMVQALANPAIPIPFAIKLRHKNGNYLTLEGVVTNLINDPAIGGIISNLRDVTERVVAEQKILKANRLYFFISQINQMIVRTTNKAKLFKEVCRIAVELGQFRMAWLGMIDELTQKVIPVMMAGEEKEWLSKIAPIALDDTPGGLGPTGTALRNDKHIICNDIEKSPGMSPWKEQSSGKPYGSSMTLPVKKFGKLIGAFSVYASESDFFDEVEIALLKEAVSDLSFALENFDKEALRKNAEEAVIKSEQRYHKLAEVSPVGIFHTDAEGYTTYVNPRWTQISGLSFEEAMGNGWVKAVHPEDKESLIKGWQEATNILDISISEYRFLRPDGSTAWVIGHAIPEKNFDNNIVGYVGTITDITERKKAEEAIKKSNERFELIAEATNDGLWDWNLETGQLWGNEMHQQLYGLTIADPVPNHEEWKRRIHPEERERTVHALEEAKASGQKSYVDEYRFRTENNGWMNVYGRTLIEYNTAGLPVRLIGSMMDITERKKTEELLAANEKRFRKLIENGNDAFAILTPEGKALYVSSSVESVLGYTEKEIYRMDMYTLVHPNNRKEVQKTMKVVMANPGVPVTSHLLRLKHKDGNWHWFEDTITNLIDDPDIGGIVNNFRDVTERVKDQMALKESEEKYRDIVENITDILCTHDLEGNILSVNLTAKKQLGYEMEQMLQMNIQDILVSPTKENFKDYIAGIIKKGYANGLMYIRTRSGENRIWEFRNTLRNNGIAPPCVYGFAQDVTERIHREEEIKTSEEKRRLIMNSALDAIICIDTIGLITFWNPQAEKIFGWEEHEVMGRSLSETIIPEPFRKMHEKGMETYLKTGEAPVLNVLLELSAVNRNNEEFPIELTILPIKQGDEEFFCAFIRDISKSRKAAEEIKLSEEKYRSLVEQASEGIFISDKDGRFITVNPSACRISQYSEAELLQMTIFDFFIDEDIQNNPIQYAALSQGKTITSERAIKRKDGGLNYLEITAKLLNDGKLLSFVRDISERIKSQNEIIKEKNLSDSIINSLPGIFYLYNKQGYFLRWNTNFEKVTLYSAEEIRELHPLDLFIEEEKVMLAKKISNVFISGEDEVQANLLLKTNEIIPYYFTGIAIDYEGEPCLMGVGIDFSEREKAQQEIKKTTEKLRELTAHLLKVREEERKRIGREIHDELGQQLTAIKMDVSWIDKKIPEATDLIKNKLKNIITLLDGSNQSIRRILSELRPGILDDYGLIEALEWQNRMFTSNTGIPVKFATTEKELKLPEPVATCIFRVYQEAFTNITRYADATKVTASLTIAHGIIKVIVSDNGKGFDTVAVQSKKSFGILGMRERVFSLNGKFTVVSSPQKGTKITISILL